MFRMGEEDGKRGEIMSNLEDLVPPLELCRKIPHGMFEDSALLWYRATISGDYICLPRLYKNVDAARTAAPAPTLAEILDAITEMELCPQLHSIFTIKGKIIYSVSCGGCCFEQGENPATAALKLWLELNKKETAK